MVLVVVVVVENEDPSPEESCVTFVGGRKLGIFGLANDLAVIPLPFFTSSRLAGELAVRLAGIIEDAPLLVFLSCDDLDGGFIVEEEKNHQQC